MIIRSYRPEDAQKLAILFFDTIRTINTKDYSAEQVEAWAPELASWDMQRWQDSFKNKFVFLAEQNDDIMGFAELENDGHIDRFYIHKDFIGKGVGKVLYQAIEEKALSLSIKKLFVEASITARPFFERMGFETVKEQTVERKQVKLNNFVMTKSLL